MWQIERRLAPSARSSATARHLTADWLNDILDPSKEDSTRAVGEATLIVSELVTNAVQANSREVRLSLAVHPDRPSVLTIVVADDAPGEPQLSAAPPSRPHGRGLVVVDALAQRWGTRWGDSTKSVWAELTIAPPRPWPS